MPPILFNSNVYDESLKTKCKNKDCVDLHKSSHLFFKDLKDFVKTCKVSDFIVFDKHMHSFSIPLLSLYTQKNGLFSNALEASSVIL